LEPDERNRERFDVFFSEYFLGAIKTPPDELCGLKIKPAKMAVRQIK
jgi:hypothetical protein